VTGSVAALDAAFEGAVVFAELPVLALVAVVAAVLVGRAGVG
jgi:hypothetical protein